MSIPYSYLNLYQMNNNVLSYPNYLNLYQNNNVLNYQNNNISSYLNLYQGNNILGYPNLSFNKVSFADIMEKVIQHIEQRENVSNSSLEKQNTTEKTNSTEIEENTQTTNSQSWNEILKELYQEKQESVWNELLKENESWWTTRKNKTTELLEIQNKHYLETSEQRKEERKQERLAERQKLKQNQIVSYRHTLEWSV